LEKNAVCDSHLFAFLTSANGTHGLKLACNKTVERSAMHSEHGGAQGFPPHAFYCSSNAALTGFCRPAENPCS